MLGVFRRFLISKYNKIAWLVQKLQPQPYCWLFFYQWFFYCQFSTTNWYTRTTWWITKIFVTEKVIKVFWSLRVSISSSSRGRGKALAKSQCSVSYLLIMILYLKVQLWPEFLNVVNHANRVCVYILELW